MKFSTLAVPGADQAATSASSFSAYDRTVPYSFTEPPSTLTVMRRASSSALRLSAASILALMSAGDTCGLTSMLLVTPTTPLQLLDRRLGKGFLILPVG